MNVQIIVKMVKELKTRAVKKLKKHGLTLSQFFRAVTFAYVAGDLDIQVVQKRPFSLTKHLKTN